MREVPGGRYSDHQLHVEQRKKCMDEPNHTEWLLDDCLLDCLGIAISLGNWLESISGNLDKVSCSVECSVDFAFGG